MSKSRHSLRMEPFEDRVMPATMNSFAHHAAKHSTVYTADDTIGLFMRPNSVVTVRHMGTGETFRVTSRYDHPVFVRIITWSGNWNTAVSAAPIFQSGSGNTQQNTNSTNTNSVANQQSTNATPSVRGIQNIASPAQDKPDISVPFGESDNVAAIAATQAAAAAELAAAYAAPTTQQVYYTSRPAVRDWTTPVPTYLEGVEIPTEAIPNPPESEEPPRADEVMPMEPPIAVPEEVEQPAAISVVIPSPGLIPFSLTALEQGVRGILEQAAELDAVISGDTGSLENYVWIGAAALVAGRALQTAWGRRSRSSDPRTLGLDSVLVRWGERHVG